MCVLRQFDSALGADTTLRHLSHTDLCDFSICAVERELGMWLSNP